RRGKQLAGLSQDEFDLLKPINLRGKGKNSALLILHGFSSSPAVYRYLIPQIKNYDAIVCPILPGHAESIEAFSQTTAKEWLATAKQACEELTKEYQKVDVLGLSMGGILACELSHLFKLNHLYLLAPALKLHMRVDSLIKLGHVLRFLGFHHVRNGAGNILTDEHAEIAYRKLPISAVMEMLTFAREYQWTPPTCPVDLFLGTHDEVVNSAEVEKLFVNLPNVSIHWLENSAHVLPLDNDLMEIIECINGEKEVV
ncbi:MAG: alpha/beta fold hydrolase, partial [Legionella sp.]